MRRPRPLLYARGPSRPERWSDRRVALVYMGAVTRGLGSPCGGLDPGGLWRRVGREVLLRRPAGGAA